VTFRNAKRVPWDDSSRIVFFGDCHRGDMSRADDFCANQRLYLDVLRGYYRRGYIYVEVGDGDELWKNKRLGDIRRAHGPVYDLLHDLNLEGRLHLLLGNHDYPDKGCRAAPKDGIPTREALVLRHTWTGQEILVLHGHQADFARDRGFGWSRTLVRHLWRHVQMLGLGQSGNWMAEDANRGRLERVIVQQMAARKAAIEKRVSSWLREHRQPIICGHTHYPRAGVPDEPAYFNTGSCVVPGQITGLEIERGQISLVQWSVPQGGPTAPVRTLLSAPQSLARLN
jgi:UDP-2,3-diacylglucosamine pyrophosphatase LpxH